MNLDKWSEKINYHAILMINSDKSDDFVTLVAYSSSIKYNSILAKIARGSEGKYSFMMTECSDEFCNPV